MNPPLAAESPVPETKDTGFPGLRTWRGVYIFVFICFVFWVVLLFGLTRFFS
ncbi:MAG: hypothetical protein JWQ04_670 [Pedosphaera sp.]|nr:hypothetical protein [Pedosphaera sp.]